MKKLIIIIALAITTSMAVTSCTEENITPSSYNGGGSGSDPKP